MGLIGENRRRRQLEVEGNIAAGQALLMDLGPVGMFEKQALVLVNRAHACGADVLALAQAVQADVQEKFAIELTPEPIFL